MRYIVLVCNSAAPETDPKVFALLKVCREREHAQALANGKLRCSHLSTYSKIEGTRLAHQDAQEGLQGVYQARQTQLSYETAEGPIVLNSTNGLIGQVLVSLNYDNPVFCLHAIHSGLWTKGRFDDSELETFKKTLGVPDSMDKFGAYVWLITNAEEFRKRFTAACRTQNIGFTGRLVQYVDVGRTHGALPRNQLGFSKLDAFSDEREYRFLLESDDVLPDPYILDVGSLEDISLVTTLPELRAHMTIMPRRIS